MRIIIGTVFLTIAVLPNSIEAGSNGQTPKLNKQEARIAARRKAAENKDVDKSLEDVRVSDWQENYRFFSNNKLSSVSRKTARPAASYHQNAHRDNRQTNEQQDSLELRALLSHEHTMANQNTAAQQNTQQAYAHHPPNPLAGQQQHDPLALTLGQSGYGNSGYGNPGYGTSGYANSGYDHSGSGHSGYGNSGYGNSG